MKIVVLDGYTENPGDISWAPLEKLGEVTVYDRTAYEESPLIAERLGDADIAVINKTPISKETIDKCPNLKGIAVLATGYNVVDYDYAKEKGIPVMNVPVYGTDNVSQFAVSLLLEVCSHIGHHSDSVHAGEWASNADWCYWHYPMIEVSGKTAGIIGLGRIGVNTAKILKAMNVNVIAYDAFQSEAGKAVAEYVELDELLAKSDFIFLHCPLFPSKRPPLTPLWRRRRRSGRRRCPPPKPRCRSPGSQPVAWRSPLRRLLRRASPRFPDSWKRPPRHRR